MVYTVYMTTNLINGRYYIGVHKTDNPNDSYLGSGKLIKRAIRKYGRKNFEKKILFVFNEQEEAYKKEAELVNLDAVQKDETYNLCIGGSISVNWSEERKQIHRLNIRGSKHPFWGKHHTKKSNQQRSETLKRSAHLRDPNQWKRSAQTRKERKYPGYWKNKTQSNSSNAKRSKSHLSLEKIQCPHCNIKCEPGNAKRWHFDNCKVVNPRKIQNRWLQCTHCNKRRRDSYIYMKTYHFDNCKYK